MRKVLAAAASLALVIIASSTIPSSKAVSAHHGRQRGLVAINVARHAGVWDRQTRTYSAAPVDYNLDGSQDVLIGYHFHGAKLWKNLGDGTYEQVAKYAWPKDIPDRHFCAWADVDDNGRPDVYCAAGRGLRNHVKVRRRHNELWLQSKRGRFREVASRWNVGDPCGRGRTVAFLDANGDRYPDLFLGNETPRDVRHDPCDNSRRLPNEDSKLFLNTHGHGFRYAPRYWDYGSGQSTRCADVLDYNGDGWDDLFTCPRSERPALYMNMHGHGFRDVTSEQHFRGNLSDAVVADLQHDGDPDLVVACPKGFAYQLNKGGHFGRRTLIFRVRVGEGMAVAVGDANGDGHPDVYGMIGHGSAGNPDDRILVNRRLSFAPIRVPAASGAADDVVALDPFGSGRAEFLALNGFKLVGRGPIQLIRLIKRN